MRLFIIAAAIVVFDQITKYLITTLMETGQSIAIINNFLYITYVLNPGAAFGMLPYQTIFFVAVTAVVVVFIIYYYRILTDDHKWLRIALALQLGGAIGNLIDRVARGGYVVDFINFTVWPPVFNVADSALVIGIGIFLIAFWRDPELRSGRS
ncbi:MAG: signal peptidase II [Dethiobacteria bacterium]|nr:signal peptidase II [Bacillota bacterium]MDW7728545.1 signal peptidase II [Bacillota bacterium]